MGHLQPLRPQRFPSGARGDLDQIGGFRSGTHSLHPRMQTWRRCGLRCIPLRHPGRYSRQNLRKVRQQVVGIQRPLVSETDDENKQGDKRDHPEGARDVLRIQQRHHRHSYGHRGLWRRRRIEDQLLHGSSNRQRRPDHCYLVHSREVQGETRSEPRLRADEDISD